MVAIASLASAGGVTSGGRYRGALETIRKRSVGKNAVGFGDVASIRRERPNQFERILTHGRRFRQRHAGEPGEEERRP